MELELFGQGPDSIPFWAGIYMLPLNGLSTGCFASPDRAGVMNSLPARHRGAGGGMNSTFMNSAQVFSLGIFFTGRSYFPSLISGPFRSGLHVAFAFSIAACLIAAAASWSRGGRYVAAEHEHEHELAEPDLTAEIETDVATDA